MHLRRKKQKLRVFIKRRGMGLSRTAFQILKRSIKMDANNKTEVTEKTAEQTEDERKQA